LPVSDLERQDESPLEADAVVLHIGPQKTGTTAIQGALHMQRERLAAHGVRYAGTGPHPREGVAAGVGKRRRSGLRPSDSEWRELVAEVTAASAERVVVSSEGFADADDDAIASAVQALGGRRAHVVVTVRPITSILPSAWQQYVRNGLQIGYDDWLHAVLDDPLESRSTPSFWRRHRYDELVERWAAVVGLDRVTVVAPDPSDPLALLRAFETLLGLPEATLELQAAATNRSLTYGEVEMVRQLNDEFIGRGWFESHYNRLIRRGAVEEMRLSHTPTAAEPTLTTPRWAVEVASGIGAAIAGRLVARGVRVIGSADFLAAAPGNAALIRPDDVAMGVPLMASSAAAHAVLGTILHGRLTAAPPKTKQQGTGKRKGAAPPAVDLSQAPARELARALLHRSRARMSRRTRS
jgi:hypothetical protein